MAGTLLTLLSGYEDWEVVSTCLLHEGQAAGLIAGDGAAPESTQQLLALKGCGQGRPLVDHVPASSDPAGVRFVLQSLHVSACVHGQAWTHKIATELISWHCNAIVHCRSTFPCIWD